MVEQWFCNPKVVGSSPTQGSLKMNTMKGGKTTDPWQADSDAYTMAQYEEIMQDSKRRAAAVKAAKSKAEDLNKRAAVMSRVSSKKVPATKSKKK